MKKIKKYTLIICMVTIVIVIIALMSCKHKNRYQNSKQEYSSFTEKIETLNDNIEKITNIKETNSNCIIDESTSVIETSSDVTIEPETTKEEVISKEEETTKLSETTKLPETTTKKVVKETTTKKKADNTTKKQTSKQEETTTKAPEVVWVDPSYGKAVTIKPCENYKDYGWELGQVNWVYTKSETTFNGEYLLDYCWKLSYNCSTVSNESEWLRFARKLDISAPTKQGEVGDVVSTNVWVCLDGFDEYYDDPPFWTFTTEVPSGNYSTNGSWYGNTVWYIWEEEPYIENDFEYYRYNWVITSYQLNGFIPENQRENVCEIISQNNSSFAPIKEGQPGEIIEVLVHIWLPN